LEVEEIMEPTIAVRPASEIDAACMSWARLYAEVDRRGGLSEASLAVMMARVAALVWVLHPGRSEVEARRKALGIVAELQAEAEHHPLCECDDCISAKGGDA
jgi:hypothetical protein